MNLKFIVYTQFINLPIDECIVTVVCKLPSEAGRCQGDFPRFFYDMDMKKCRQFTYGGCRGNQNNFDTLQECQQFCESVMRDQGTLFSELHWLLLCHAKHTTALLYNPINCRKMK